MMASKAEKAVTKAEAYKAKVDVAIADMQKIKVVLKGIRSNCSELSAVITCLAHRFDKVKVEDSCDLKAFEQMMILGKALKQVLDIVVLKDNGSANENIKSQISGYLELGIQKELDENRIIEDPASKSEPNDNSQNNENIVSYKKILRGQRLNLAEIIPNNNDFEIVIDTEIPGSIIDFCCFGLDSSGKLSDECYMTFFNQLCTPCRGIYINDLTDKSACFSVSLEKLPTSIHRVIFTSSIDGNATISQIVKGHVGFVFNETETASFNLISSDYSTERALMLLEVYRKGDLWRISAIGQGFNGGLEFLVHHFGGTVAQE